MKLMNEQELRVALCAANKECFELRAEVEHLKKNIQVLKNKLINSKTNVIGRGLLKDRKISLRSVRKSLGQTQADVATTAEIDQAEVSRLERRDDAKLSTLRRYARALGGDLEIIILLKTGHQIHIDI